MSRLSSKPTTVKKNPVVLWGDDCLKFRRTCPAEPRQPAEPAPPRGRDSSNEVGIPTSVVRNVCLYYPINFRIWVPKPCKTAKFSNQLNVFPMSPVFVTTPFLVQKALKTANSEKCVFSCQTSKVVPEPPSSLVFCRKPAPRVCCGSRAPSPQGFSRPDSPPRTRLNVRQPAKVVRQPAELVTTDVTAPSGSVFWCKKRSKRSSPKSPFFVSDCKWDAQASRFSVESGF